MKITHRSCVVGCGRARGEKRWADVRGRFQRLFRCSKERSGVAGDMVRHMDCSTQFAATANSDGKEREIKGSHHGTPHQGEPTGQVCEDFPRGEGNNLFWTGDKPQHWRRKSLSTMSFISLSLWQETGCFWMSWRFVSFIKLAHCLKGPDHSLLFHGFRAFLSLSHSARGSRRWHGMIWRK